MIREIVIDIAKLRKVYRESIFSRQPLEALRGIDLQVFRGEAFGLLGPNGAGKTTLIKILLGILHATRGTASVLGQPAGSMAARERIGYLPENMAFPRHHTGRDALYFYGRLNKVPESEIRRREKPLLDLVGLLGREREFVRKYSKGMRQRLGLAQAMMHDPDVLIMDEPTDGLDPVGRSQIRDVIDQLRQKGKTVFLNSHILQEVELVCDRVAIMAKGQIQGVGTIESLTAQHQSELRLHVRLELIATFMQVKQILAPRECRLAAATVVPVNPNKDNMTTNPNAVEEPTCSVDVDADGQADVDAMIDALRAANISIVRCEPFRPRLEHVFLSMVQAGQN